MINTIYAIISIITLICYYIVRFTKIPILCKDIIHILLCIVGTVVAIYSLIHNDYGYFFGFVTAAYIFESFGTSEDK